MAPDGLDDEFRHPGGNHQRGHRKDIGDLHSPPRSRTTLPPCPALVIALAILSAASRNGSSAKCAYRIVVRCWVWPSKRPINGKLSPPPAPVAANVCRRS